MARPPQANAERTRARILKSASKLFSDKGIGNTSMREIARGAGVTQATVHHYFGSKDDLHTAAVTAMYAELAGLRQQLTTLLDGSPDLSLVIERIVRTSIRFAREHVEAVRLAFREVVDSRDMPPTQAEQLIGLMREAVPAFAALTNNSEESIRFTLQSLVYLIVRYAMASPAEHSLVVEGNFVRRARHDKAHLRAVEDHLVKTAQTMLGVPVSVQTP